MQSEPYDQHYHHRPFSDEIIFMITKSIKIDENHKNNSKMYQYNNNNKYTKISLRKQINLLPSFIFVTLFGIVNSEICRQIISNSSKIDITTFECPRLFESRIKSWCCHSNTLQPTCCPWSERIRESEQKQQLTLTIIVRNLFIIIISAFLLLIILYCICKFKNNRKILYYGSPSSNLYCRTPPPHTMVDPSCPPATAFTQHSLTLNNNNTNDNNTDNNYEQSSSILDPPPPYYLIEQENKNNNINNNNTNINNINQYQNHQFQTQQQQQQIQQQSMPSTIVTMNTDVSNQQQQPQLQQHHHQQESNGNV